MTIVYIGTEHHRVLEHAEFSPSHHAKIEMVRDRLATASGQLCEVRHFTAVSPTYIEQRAPLALVIGGNLTNWAEFDDADLAGLFATIRTAPMPILGICAGHQLIGRAHGAAWGPLGTLQRGEVDPDPDFGPGQRKECGFMSVEVNSRCPIFRDVAPISVMFQHHYWHLEEVPAGFVVQARSQRSPIQAIERIDRPVFGVQFHVERYDADHPHGEAVLRSFFALARKLTTNGFVTG